jgi:hypothetical protein
MHLVGYQKEIFYWRCNPLWVCILQPSSGVIASSRTRFLDHIQCCATFSRTPLDVSPSLRPLPDNTQSSQQTNIHASGGIQTHDRNRRAAVDLHLRPRDYWEICMVLPSRINETSVVEYLFFHPIVSYYSDYSTPATGTFTNPSCCCTS